MLTKEKRIKIAAYVSLVITIILGVGILVWKGLIPTFLQTSISEAASIGIIGGADGPTAIYITTKITGESILKLLAVGLAILTMILFWLKMSRKKK